MIRRQGNGERERSGGIAEGTKGQLRSSSALIWPYIESKMWPKTKANVMEFSQKFIKLAVDDGDVDDIIIIIIV